MCWFFGKKKKEQKAKEQAAKVNQQKVDSNNTAKTSDAQAINKSAVKAPEANTASEKAKVSTVNQPDNKDDNKTQKAAVSPAATVEKSQAVKPAAKKAPDKATRPGKWLIEKKADKEYISLLKASNGETMLTSEIYSSEDGARASVATIVKNADIGKFVIYSDKKGNFYYKLKTANNKLLCIGEIYSTRAVCENAAERVKLLAPISPIDSGVVEGEEYIKYVPDPNFQPAKVGGKWKILEEEHGFVGKLFASNGELMLATEGVSTYAAAKSGIENVQKNVSENNFVIDRDKSGKYYYKLRNAQKSTLCVGESYDTLSACSSAIESVKKFCGSSLVE